MRDNGQLISASFLNPGKETFKVSEIKITGYEEDPGYYMAQDYSADFYILDPSGRAVKGKNTYFEYRDPFDWVGYSGFLGGKWYNNGEEITALADNDFELEAGQAVWFTNPGGGEAPFQFVTAGEVIQAEIPFPLADSGNGVGNPMATGVWVSDLFVTGYQEDPGYFMAQDYSADFYILDDAGRAIKEDNLYFEYRDPFDWIGYSGFLGGKWYNNGVEVVQHGAGDVQLQPGQGIWFSNPGGGEKPFVLTFPQVVGEQATK